uniref:Glucose-methanol-choline oxidoreductase C-terminal domain-containing protein n=1 Tax=Oryza rufipogon TaxID=4529 RepID=A0A0E0QHW9_ORYRU
MHHIGCCRMGTMVGDGIVDARGESWEAEQLYVCNDSVQPTTVGINPMITVQSVAYCVVNGIVDSLSELSSHHMNILNINGNTIGMGAKLAWDYMCDRVQISLGVQVYITDDRAKSFIYQLF